MREIRNFNLLLMGFLVSFRSIHMSVDAGWKRASRNKKAFKPADASGLAALIGLQGVALRPSSISDSVGGPIRT